MKLGLFSLVKDEIFAAVKLVGDMGIVIFAIRNTDAGFQVKCDWFLTIGQKHWVNAIDQMTVFCTLRSLSEGNDTVFIGAWIISPGNPEGYMPDFIH